jgi:ankyrin repeat protein
MLNTSKLYKNLCSGYYYTTSNLSYFTSQTTEQGGKDVNVVDLEGFTKLHIAVRNQSLRETIKFISQGADVNKRSANELSCTPLHISVSIRNFDITEYLLQNSANTEIKDFENRNALQIAAYN